MMQMQLESKISVRFADNCKCKQHIVVGYVKCVLFLIGYVYAAVLQLSNVSLNA